MNTNHNKVEKKINNARKALFCFIFIFVGVFSVFSHQIYIVQPQQTHNAQQSFERKLNVLQRQFEDGVKKVWKNCELKMGVVENQLEIKLNKVHTDLIRLLGR